MNDPWNTAGVSWSNDNIERELARVARLGQILADRFAREKLLLIAVVFVTLLICTYVMSPTVGLIVELAVIYVVFRRLKKTGGRSMAPVYQMCDPYLEFAYLRAYVRKKLPRTKSTLARQVLSLAQCMALAGETDAALSIQRLLKPDDLKASEKSIYYNTLLLCYGQRGWTEKRTSLTSKIRSMAADAKPREAMYLNLILRLEEVKRRQEMGDIGYVEEYFQKVPPVYCFQAVGMHYSLAMMHMKNGDAEGARPHVEFVLDKGNKLYYKRDLEDYLRKSLEEETI